ncbi:hypothetical protein NIES267_55730 [Calothrix parasitica NIES-267]|uniref:Uncharacterized protein n=1 Tax=Calothrix parasitica NIES-267 TaxID=1973488 RepID=A0A1Z4LXU0_9CYAN|nr:hypothetical protein NIES267_55730 [Calothrix parasitica NIES-267]
MRQPRLNSKKINRLVSNPVKLEDKLISEKEEERNNDIVYIEEIYERLDGSRYCLEFIKISPYFNSGSLDAWYISEM